MTEAHVIELCEKGWVFNTMVLIGLRRFFLLNDLEVFLGDEVPIGVEAKFVFPGPGKTR